MGVRPFFKAVARMRLAGGAARHVQHDASAHVGRQFLQNGLRHEGEVFDEGQRWVVRVARDESRHMAEEVPGDERDANRRGAVLPHGLGEVHQVRGREEDLGADETLVLIEP